MVLLLSLKVMVRTMDIDEAFTWVTPRNPGSAMLNPDLNNPSSGNQSGPIVSSIYWFLDVYGFEAIIASCIFLLILGLFFLVPLV